MALSGNKGEWSELYVLFRLLADGRLNSGDGKLNINLEKFFPILKVFRSDDIEHRTEYTVIENTHSILIKQGNSSELILSQSEFDRQAKILYYAIKELSSSGSIEDAELFMKRLGESNIGHKASEKSDIRIVIHDLRTGTTPELGYSIKSKLGGNSTLVNSSKDASNFIFRINGFPQSEVDRFNSLQYFKHKTDLLNNNNSSLEFVDTARETMRTNLDMLDTSLVRIIAECLKLYYLQRARDLKDCCDILNEENPLGFNLKTQKLFYEYKIKQFLLAFALGMTVGTVWDGKFNANGGYIIVKEDGSIVSYHFFDRNDLEDYLFYNTYFETPSTSRHDYGYVYQENGQMLLKLNIQIRFK